MPKRKKQSQNEVEPDSSFFLKLVLYVILGSLWLKFQHPIQLGAFVMHGFPLGLLIGMVFASHDHFQIDRKIEYTVLVLITIVTFFLPAGIVI